MTAMTDTTAPDLPADGDDGSRAQQAVQAALDRRDNGGDAAPPGQP